MNQLIIDYSLQDTFGYVDNITIGGRTQGEHETYVQNFMNMINDLGLTLDKHKNVSSVSSTNLLGYCSHGQLKHYPEHLQPLLDLSAPTNTSTLKPVVVCSLITLTGFINSIRKSSLSTR